MTDAARPTPEYLLPREPMKTVETIKVVQVMDDAPESTHFLLRDQNDWLFKLLDDLVAPQRRPRGPGDKYGGRSFLIKDVKWNSGKEAEAWLNATLKKTSEYYELFFEEEHFGGLWNPPSDPHARNKAEHLGLLKYTFAVDKKPNETIRRFSGHEVPAVGFGQVCRATFTLKKEGFLGW